MSVLELFLLEIFRNSFYCHLLFNYQCSFVVSRQLPKNIKCFFTCQQKFSSFLKSGERGIWTLAPVARPTPLAGAPLRPLEYFSELLFTYDIFTTYFCSAKVIILNVFLLVNQFFIFFTSCFYPPCNLHI